MPAPQRPRVPEYPRPVAVICTDEAPVCHDTIIYEQWTDEAENEADKRATKRRKVIRDAANSYLRGESVFILTAGLKGPFDDGWKNPWARRRQQKELEIPETTMRGALTKQTFLKEKGVSMLVGPTHFHQQTPSKTVHSLCEEDLKNVFNARSCANKPAMQTTRPSSAKKVEDWLKKIEARNLSRDTYIHSSPTPAVKARLHESRFSTHDDPVVTIDDGGGLQPDPNPASTALKQTIEDFTPQNSQISQPSHESPQRAEAAILEQKRQSIHKVPPSTHLLEFEYRRPRPKAPEAFERRSEEDQAVANIDIPMKQVADPRDGPSREGVEAQRLREDGGEILNHDPVSVPGLSTEISKASTLQNLPSTQLPSAQITAAPRQAAMRSNAYSTESLLREVAPVSSKEDAAGQAASLAADRDGLQTSEKENRPVQAAEPELAGADAGAATSSLEKTPVRELETQEMIAAIKPFEFSTIRKPAYPSTESRSPKTATKRPAAKEKKKASFALKNPHSSDSSQRSINASMKISKVTAQGAKEKTSRRRPLFASLDSVMYEVCDDKASLEDSFPSVFSMFGTKKGQEPKGILKSSVAYSTAPVVLGATNTTSTSLKQDAQIVQEQPGQNATDDAFDLDGAIDDLGSYLGTWDPEKEAKKLTV